MKSSLKNWSGTAVVLGVDWGDSGKGRLIDDLASRADIIARYNGGSNTGHSVENKHGKFALHIMPSGIFNSRAKCLVGRNVAVDMESLVAEMNMLDIANVSYQNLVIDKQASLTMPWHKLRDGIREKFRKNKVGTTGRGVGPTYADRTERVGLLVGDLISPDFKKKLEEEVKIQNKFFDLNLKASEIYQNYQKITKRVKKYIGKTTSIITDAKKNSKNILFEGAQGYFLDIDSGTYPFVTSSNPGVIGVWRSFDLHPAEIDHVIGITKAYTTRVGSGPMPTKIEGLAAKHIVEVGQEIGVTTGRIRQPGWLDMILIKAAIDANKITALAVTKLDVLSGIKKIKLCTAYRLNGKKVDYLSHDADFLEKIKPQFEEHEGWGEDISQVRKFEDLPKNAKSYINSIESFTNVEIKFISVGPKRGQVIYK